MTNEGHLWRCYLRVRIDDPTNLPLVVCDHNLRKILAWLGSFASGLGVDFERDYPPSGK